MRRQRRTIRFVQLLLVAVAVGSGWFAVRSLLGDAGLDQAVVLALLGVAGLGVATLLSDGRDVRIPTPARLEELAGRAERAAIERAEEQASARD